jgi:hypothetical protein
MEIRGGRIMPKANDPDHFIPDRRMPTARLGTTLHAGYAAMARYRSSGIVLLDEEQPSYLVTDDFIHASLLSEAGELSNSVAIEGAALVPIAPFVRRTLIDADFERHLQDILGQKNPMVLRISPRSLDADANISETGELSRYGLYRVTSPLPSGSGWHTIQGILSKKIFTPPAAYTCQNGHQNDDFDRGVCIVQGCGAALITRP